MSWICQAITGWVQIPGSTREGSAATPVSPCVYSGENLPDLKRSVESSGQIEVAMDSVGDHRDPFIVNLESFNRGVRGLVPPSQNDSRLEEVTG